MKKSYKIFLKTLFVSLSAGIIFFAVGYSYLSVSDYEAPADNEVSSVPYYSSVPESAGIMLEIGSHKTFFHLNFEDEELAVIYADNVVSQDDEIYGYKVDYTLKAENKVLENIVDTLGGIDLEAGEEALNYTGVQVTELIDSNKDNTELRRSVTEQLIARVGEYGLSNEDFLYIIKNSETDLTVPDCYFWAEYIGGLCRSVRYVN